MSPETNVCIRIIAIIGGIYIAYFCRLLMIYKKYREAKKLRLNYIVSFWQYYQDFWFNGFDFAVGALTVFLAIVAVVLFVFWPVLKQ